jgi:hypothetical protein
MALSCCQTMVFSAVSQPEAIMMRGWLSTFGRFASQFDSDTLDHSDTSNLRPVSIYG